VGTVAKRLIGGLPAAAKTYRSTPRQSEGLSFRINDLKIAFDTERTIMVYGYLGCRQFFLLGSSLHHTALLAQNSSGRADESESYKFGPIWDDD
jgi:hypothetical protein